MATASPPATFLFRDAGPGDAEALSVLFAETFREVFGHLYDPANLHRFLLEQDAAHWRGQLGDPSFAIRIAEDGGMAGYAKLGPLKLPVAPAGPALELRQFYLAPRARGTDAARVLIAWAVSEARARGAAELYLSVYTDNPRARRFYARHGFTDVGPTTFMVGDQADEDIVMRLALG